MPMNTGLNFRAGLDQLNQANDQTANALQRQAALQRQRNAENEERQRYANSQIVQGLKGIGDAIDQTEERRQKKQIFDQQQKLNEMEIQQKQQMNPLQLQRAQKDIDSLDASTKATVQSTQMQAETAARTKQQSLASAQGVVDAAPTEIKSRIPKSAVTTEEQAAFITGEMKQKESTLDNQKKIADINKSKVDAANSLVTAEYTKAETLSKKVETYGKVSAIAAGPNNAALLNAIKDPSQIPLMDKDLDSPATKESWEANRKAFEKTKELSGVANKRLAITGRIAELGGAKDIIDPATGQIDDAKVKIWADNMGGFDGLMDTINKKPNASQVKTEMARLIVQAVQEKVIPSMSRENEQILAKKLYGQDPNINDPDEAGSIIELYGSLLNKEDKAKTFFQTELSQVNEERQTVKSAFEENQQFNYIDPDKKAGVMWDMMNTGQKGAVTGGQQAFMKLPPQQQANMAYGFNEQGQPNFIVGDEWNRHSQIAEALRDPEKRNKMLSDSMPKSNPFEDDPALKRQFEMAQEVKRNALGMSGSPAAVAGVKPGDNVPTQPGGAGFSVKVSGGNPNAAVIYDATRGVFRAVEQPNGLPAAGATPPPAAADQYKKAVVTKYNLEPTTWESNIKKAFRGNKREDEQGDNAFAQ